jgi:hypothetical protein
MTVTRTETSFGNRNKTFLFRLFRFCIETASFRDSVVLPELTGTIGKQSETTGQNSAFCCLICLLLSYSSLCCPWTCRFCNSLSCPWTYQFYSSLCTGAGLVRTASVLQQPLLSLDLSVPKVACAVSGAAWTCLTYSSLCSL